MRPSTAAKYPKDWAKISWETRKGKNHTCEFCGRGPGPAHQITVHHIDYDPGNNRSENLIVLCAPCHLVLQNFERKYGRISPKQTFLSESFKTYFEKRLRLPYKAIL